MLTVTEADGSARVWDALTGKPVTAPLRCDGPVWSAQFSPDGRRIVAASADRTARVWDAQTGQPLTEPLRHNFPVLSAVYSPDGKWVLTVAGSAAYLWPVPPAPTPVPDWFLNFVEAVAGQSMDKVGLFEPVSWLDFTEAKRRLAESPPSDFYASFATWFLEDRTTRTISPWSSLRVRDYRRFQDQ